ncbi:hypothetical protein BFJ63_vAg17971 [Fusarium oxysporum f. sp. narcissi]|uniref:Uncharacterized protein n=1 Tax=Fusarium oxysporum f. sp. narcissi TaxID=451672 RepID=A0A4Q2UYJ2_FUSOX|nr:hypothetical protein BFJ63_vAg17971 [Fusarium oxysporum f. sp. narcissi]
MTTFLYEVFQDLWVPETIAFIACQVRRGLNRGICSGGRSGVGVYGDTDMSNEESAQAMIVLEAWEMREGPFRISNFEKLSAEVLKFDDRSTEESKIVLKTRRDFAEEMFVALIEGGRKGHPGVESIAPTHSTWPSTTVLMFIQIAPHYSIFVRVTLAISRRFSEKSPLDSKLFVRANTNP